MKLYGHPMSTCVRKVLCTLAEKGHEAELVMVDLMKGEQRSPEHLARQPFGVVPVLEDDGFMLYESRAIIRYLDAKLGGPSLTPADIKDRGLMEQWIGVEQSYFSGPTMKAVAEIMFAPMRGKPTDSSVVDKGKAEAAKVLDVIEKGLAGKEYLAGTFSLADITYLPYLEYLFATNLGDIVRERPNVASWWGRISERPSWRKVTGKGQ
jgi:glutathione S-transferase